MCMVLDALAAPEKNQNDFGSMIVTLERKFGPPKEYQDNHQGSEFYTFTPPLFLSCLCTYAFTLSQQSVEFRF